MKKKKKLQKNYKIARLFICTKKISLCLYIKKNLSDVNCCSKLISDKISKISFKKLSLMFKVLIEFYFVKVAIERKTVAKFSKMKIITKKNSTYPDCFCPGILNPCNL